LGAAVAPNRLSDTDRVVAFGRTIEAVSPTEHDLLNFFDGTQT